MTYDMTVHCDPGHHCPPALRDCKDRVCFHVVFTELYIGTHKMVSNRAPKCK